MQFGFHFGFSQEGTEGPRALRYAIGDLEEWIVEPVPGHIAIGAGSSGYKLAKRDGQRTPCHAGQICVTRYVATKVAATRRR